MSVRSVGLLVLLIFSLAVLPLAAKARQGKPTPTIGVLMLGAPPTAPEWKEHSPFLQELRRLGWVEGQNVTVEYRWAQGGSVSSMTWPLSSYSCLLISLWPRPRQPYRH
jgi:hypothetical protein